MKTLCKLQSIIEQKLLLYITITTITIYSINKAIHPLVLLSPIQQTISKHMISVKHVLSVEMTKKGIQEQEEQ